MDLVRFSAFTVIGSLIWVSILAYIGFIVGNNMALVEAYYKQAVVILVVAMVIVLGIYVFWHKSRAKPGNI
jgi:membrane protein DedA with SNARE-associated domain